MRVLYDSTCFAQAYGGVSRYYCEMIRNLPKDVESIIPLKETVNKYLQEAPFNISEMKVSVHDFVRKYFNGWYMPGVSYLYKIASFILPGFLSSGEKLNRNILQKHIEELDFDVYHVTGPNYYNKAWRKVKGKKPIVVTVHDLIFDKIVKDRRTIMGRREILFAADSIIAVSECTKNDIVSFYGVDSKKITVVYHGSTWKPVASQLSGDYLLYVGQRWPYKNWDWMIRGVANYLKENNIKLLCVGNEFTNKERLLLEKLKIKENVIAQNVTDGELQKLYASAIAFVYPSRYEGFGLPILESWTCGCPVILSDASCFPEIAKDAAVYFSLDDTIGLLRAISEVQSPNRAILKEKGYAASLLYSWSKCAEETRKVYEKIV